MTTYYFASTGNFNGSTQCSKAGCLLGKSNVSEQRVYWLRSKISTYRRDLERDLPNFNPILCNYGKPWRFSRTLRSWWTLWVLEIGISMGRGLDLKGVTVSSDIMKFKWNITLYFPGHRQLRRTSQVFAHIWEETLTLLSPWTKNLLISTTFLT